MKRQPHLSLPGALVYAAAAMFAVLPRLGAQLPDQKTEVHLVAGEAVIEWFGHGGRTYFLQISDDIDPAGHLKTWLWAAAIESGNDEFISYEFGGDTSRGFARLQYTDEPKPAGVELEDWDIDGDGLSNFAELTGNPQSNPLKFSTSDTGISDGWAIAHGLDPNDPSIAEAPFGTSGLSNLDAYQAGVQAHPDATVEDHDGDGLDNDADADPNDQVIDWSAGPRPAFAVVELPGENVDELWFDDLTDSGTALFTRVQNGASISRVIIDRNQQVYTFACGASPSGGDFAGYSAALFGDKVPGFRLVGGSSEECLWDPADDSFTAWQWAGTIGSYHDDIRDERNGGFVWLGPDWATLDWTSGLRTSLDGALLPGEPQATSWGARIERGGNIVSDHAYWRWNEEEEEFDAPALLPAWSWIRSATLERSDPHHYWNLVAGIDGLLISKDGGPFVKAAGTVGSAGVRGVTEQGWAWRVNDNTSSLWANGQWQALAGAAGLLGEDYSEVEILDMLDTGLGVAKIRKGTDPRKLALLLPFELRDINDHSNSGDDETITQWDTTQDIANKNIAWIDAHTSAQNPAPRMPQLEFRMPGLPAGFTILAKLEVKYERGNGARHPSRTDKDGNTDTIQIPEDGSYKHVGDNTWKIWNEYPMEDEGFFGGDATLTYKIPNGTSELIPPQILKFRIGGRNLDPVRARQFIGSLENAGPTGDLWFSYAIAKSETKDRNNNGTR